MGNGELGFGLRLAWRSPTGYMGAFDRWFVRANGICPRRGIRPENPPICSHIPSKISNSALALFPIPKEAVSAQLSALSF
ncbi:MAG: hypothetical protein F6J93_00495 [Oscillatoria sp. SIO1A7]|nr:hypothetical protein [Oscillatoria sp. SIO1A7]